MRARHLLAVLVLCTTGLAGCLGGEPGPSEAASTDAADQLDLDAPDDATVEELEEGVRLAWTDVELPFETDVEVPPNATVVRAEAEVDGPYVRMTNADTGRRRCNVDLKHTWEDFHDDVARCSGLAVVDDLPANWTVTANGAPEAADRVTVDILTSEIEGPAAELDLDKLDKPTRELQETESVRIASHDGTELYAEVTLPEGEGPWPVIIASSPYNSGYHANGEPSMWEYWTQDWAKRGYAVVNADVRGTGRSDGCMEVWGPNEAADQAVLVEWAADQNFSTGDVGFYGQSYVGTTPVQAAVQDPEGLEAIIAVAPVVNAYEDWHFGGVPNGENVASPAFYQASTGGASDVEWDPTSPTEGDPLQSAVQAANGLCDPTLTADANDPRAIYDDFYEVRNFSLDADQVTAATLYTHGFEDTNVKSSMIDGFFNEISAEKLALTGHWDHQHPTRADNEALFLGWMAEHLKGKEIGFDRVGNVSVLTDGDTHRTADAWPPEDAADTRLYPSFDDDGLGTEPGEGSASVVLDPAGAASADRSTVELTGTAGEDLHVAGDLGVDLAVSLAGADNAYVGAFLYHDDGDGEDLATFGMANLAHRDGHDSYEPVPPGETVEMQLPFVPTERQIEEGDELRLVLRGVQAGDWAAAEPTRPGQLTFHAGEDGTALSLPTVEDPATTERPVATAP
jgi:putative CocE/NonD family hydrolase